MVSLSDSDCRFLTKGWVASDWTLMMSTTASIGNPEVADVFPPKRNGRLVPAPAWWQNWTATGSLIAITTAHASIYNTVTAR